MLKRLILIATLLLAAGVQAETIKFAWDKPVSNSDGSPLKLSGYRFYISAAPGTYGPATTTLGPTALGYTFLVPPTLAGKRLYAVVTAYNAEGESEPSNEVTFVPAPKPLAPKTLSFGVSP